MTICNDDNEVIMWNSNINEEKVMTKWPWNMW